MLPLLGNTGYEEQYKLDSYTFTGTSNLSYITRNRTNLQITWTNGDGDGVLVLMHKSQSTLTSAGCEDFLATDYPINRVVYTSFCLSGTTFSSRIDRRCGDAFILASIPHTTNTLTITSGFGNSNQYVNFLIVEYKDIDGARIYNLQDMANLKFQLTI